MKGGCGDPAGTAPGILLSVHTRRDCSIKARASHGTEDIHRKILMNFPAQVFSKFALVSKFCPCETPALMQQSLTRILCLQNPRSCPRRITASPFHQAGLHQDGRFAHFGGNRGGAADWVGEADRIGGFYLFGRYGDGEPVYSIVSWCMALVAAM